MYRTRAAAEGKEYVVAFVETTDVTESEGTDIAVAALARELACFVWGMMTENIEEKAA